MKTKVLPVRFEESLLEEMKEVAKKMSQPGMNIGVSTVVRMAVVRGLPLLKKEKVK